MKWWEKSVEYYFVKKFLPLETMISAFDGKHEQIGDVLLQHADRWIMIEFKVDKDAISSEKNKFHDYELAFEELSAHDSHHFLIYGAIHSENEEFCLCGDTYFSGQPSGNIKKILASGLKKDAFLTYLDRFLFHKNGGPKGGGGGGGLTFKDYALVAGISCDNKIVECKTLQEFGLENGLKIEHEKVQSRGYSIDRDLDGPSFP
ncbi:hypothetical protein [Vibrio tasmaniensis]|uniref:hypothetical protein n=1 Tax=Vibrio tasmaniensis TaxID=212663 RepID=UPI00111ADE10|nr:hypothetical protein [Vibrio tasmaniensis]